MPTLNGGEALIQSLSAEGIRTIFGIPGLGQYEAMDAIYMSPELRYITVRNEQATTYMADGYARASGEIAAALVVPGPGVLNATAGMATAYAVSSPVLVITGTDHQREGHDDERDPPLLHSLAKWTARAERVEDVPDLVHQAMQQLRSGRRRPVVLEVPHAVLAARASVTLPNEAPIRRPAAEPSSLAQAIAHMQAAKRPLIWTGGGVHTADAADLVTQLAESWPAPVVSSRGGKGALSDRHALSLGYAELRYTPLQRYVAESDLILALGTSTQFDRLPGHGDRQIIRVDIDPAQIQPNELGLVGDALRVLDQIVDQWNDSGANSPGDNETTQRPARAALEQAVAAINEARFKPDEQLQPQWDFMQAIRHTLPDDAAVAFDMTQMGYYSRSYYPVYASRSYLHCSRLWTLGAAFPLGLGAKLAQPDRTVVSILGDGGFLYNAQELATAMKYQIPLVTIVFNDNAYGNVLRAQQEEYDDHVIGTRLHNPDFVQLAQSYGVEAMRVERAPELAEALGQAIASTWPTLIEVPVGPMQRIF